MAGRDGCRRTALRLHRTWNGHRDCVGIVILTWGLLRGSGRLEISESEPDDTSARTGSDRRFLLRLLRRPLDGSDLTLPAMMSNLDPDAEASELNYYIPRARLSMVGIYLFPK